jgi:hypothetical protein
MVYKANCCIESALPAKPAEAIKKKRAVHRRLGKAAGFKWNFFSSGLGQKNNLFWATAQKFEGKKLLCLPTANCHTARISAKQLL